MVGRPRLSGGFASAIILRMQHDTKTQGRRGQRSDVEPTPLLTILRQLEDDERRDEFAHLAGTSRGYLYQLSGRHRSCNVVLARRIADASVQMNAKYGSDIVTMEQLADMLAPEA